MNEIVVSKKFTKQIKKYKGTKDLDLINQTIKRLQLIEPEENGSLPQCHKLSGNKKDLWDYHIKFDLVILFSFDSDKKIVELFEIGNHNNILK